MAKAKIISKEQIKRVYALGAGLGLVDNRSKSDMLHELVLSVTGKDSVSSLTEADFIAVQTELIERMKLSNRAAPLKKKQDKPNPQNVPDMMTQEQKSLAWRLMYRLQELDTNPYLHEDGSPVTVGERMQGALKKTLGVTAGLKDPFRWVSLSQGEKFIETLKRYVRTAERKAEKLKAGGD